MFFPCVLMDHKFNWFRYSWFLLPSIRRLHTWRWEFGFVWWTHGVSNALTPLMTIRWQTQALPIVSSSCFNYHHITCGSVAIVTGLDLPTNSRLAQWRTTLCRPRKQAVKSIHHHRTNSIIKWLPITTLLWNWAFEYDGVVCLWRRRAGPSHVEEFPIFWYHPSCFRYGLMIISINFLLFFFILFYTIFFPVKSLSLALIIFGKSSRPTAKEKTKSVRPMFSWIWNETPSATSRKMVIF
jgi:hypothetical protein